MKEVYILTSGSYSDYHIDAVFLSKKKALSYINNLRIYNREPTIGMDKMLRDYVEIYEANPKPAKKGQCKLVTGVFMCRDGNVPSVESVKDEGTYYHKKIGFNNFRGKGEYEVMYWVVDTEDIERAVKVVNEKRQQIIALNIWGDNDMVRKLVK